MAERSIRLPLSIGDRFGRWTIIGPEQRKAVNQKGHTHPARSCRCDCGTERVVLENGLRRGATTSCGCWAREWSSKKHTKHGASRHGTRTPEFSVWQAMMDRCNNENNPRYADYGGRGIAIDLAWDDFSTFLKDVGPRPSARHQLDRERNDEGYGPTNCRWVLPKENMRNRRRTRFVDVDGVDIPLAELAEKSGIPANTLRARLLAGWSVHRAMTSPLGPTGPRAGQQAKVRINEQLA